MFGYRCYFLDPQWRISSLQEFYAGNDTEAIVTARALSMAHEPRGFELWEGLRQVHREGY
jgi:hypothetical protein